MEATMVAGAHFSRADEGEVTWFLQNRMALRATAATTGGAFGLVESWIAPYASPPLHIHRREDESFWVLEGRVRFRCGDQEIVGGPGTFVFLPRDVPHTFVVESAEGAHILTLLTPGGGERFFVEGGRPPAGPGLPPPGPLDIERLERAAEQFGSEIVGPPMAPSAVDA
jgi:quercetin dioxygenase-like cupin family protein